MKKLVLPLLLLLGISMLLAQTVSEPSAVVGYVKYDMIEGNTIVAIPMDAGFTMASEVAMSYGGTCDAISYFGPDEFWYTAYTDGTDWYDDFPVQPGSCVMMYAYDTTPFYSIGNLPSVNATYNLIEGNSIVAIPLNRSDLSTASAVGNDIGTDTVSYFGTDELWYSAYTDGTDWYDDFGLSIGTPVMVYSYSEATWPARSMGNNVLNVQSK